MKPGRGALIRSACPILWAVIFHCHVAAAGQPPRLLYAEPLAATWEAVPQARSVNAGAGGRGTLRFHAFGRNFDVTLAPNARITQDPGSYVAEAGVMDATPGSWARITRRRPDLIGLIFDGREYYGIEPADSVAEFLDPAAPPPSGGNLIYRLSDLLVDPGSLACGLEAGPGGLVSATAAVKALAAELDTPTMMAALGPTHRVTLAPVADVEFASRYGANADSEIVARLNIVDGIFSEQVGIDIAATTPTVFRSASGSYPFTADDATTLLGQVSDYRLDHHGPFGLTHLFTGKSLGSSLVGIAWQGAACFPRESAGLSTSAGLSALTSALVAAHEIGHNFGAPHDAEAGSACESTPATYLMAARTTGSSTFSACSLGHMAAVIAERANSYPSCLVSLSDYDLSVVTPGPITAEPGAMTDLVIAVQNLGTQAASALNLRLSTPAQLVISAVSPTLGLCDFGPADTSCDLAGLPAGGSWIVTVQVSSEVARSYTVTTSVSATTDRDMTNNTAQFSVAVGNPGGSGGGSSLDWVALAVLALAAVCRRVCGRHFSADS